MWPNFNVQTNLGTQKTISVIHHVMWLPEVSFNNTNKAPRVAHLNSWKVKNAEDWVMGRDSDLIDVGYSFGTGIFTHPPAPLPPPGGPKVQVSLRTTGLG